MIHYIECWKDNGEPAECRTLCGEKEYESGTQNAINVTCEDCKYNMGIAGTFYARKMQLERLMDEYN